MKFCRHDWLVHKIQKGHSLRHDLIIGSKEIPWFTFALCYAIGFAMIYLPNFYTIQIPTILIFPLSLISGAGVLAIVVMIFGDILGEHYDPWLSEDKSCLKCGKIKFDATKNEDRVEKRIEAKKLREIARVARQDAKEENRRVAKILRNKNLTIAKDRYKNLLEQYQQDINQPQGSRH
jgi:hypothetical protein